MHPIRLLLASFSLAALIGAPAAQAAGPPNPRTLGRGWEVRDERAAPALPQPAPPEETQPEAAATRTSTLTGRTSQAGPWRRARVPSVFDPLAMPSLYGGTVKRYRLRFRAPNAKGFRWMLQLEQARRNTGVFLNGRRIGRSLDPYVPFEAEAEGLRRGRVNRLEVLVDNRKDPRIAEGWWNWGGIVRPVRLTPVGTADVGKPNTGSLGVMPKVRCRLPARSCKAVVEVDALVRRRMARRIKPVVTVRLRSPRGRVTTKRFRLARQQSKQRRVKLRVKVPRPVLWSPDRPALYLADITVRDRGEVQQRQRLRIGLRSMQVKAGLLFLNNRRIQLKGASIHEDMPGHGAALSRFDNRTIVRELQDLGANVTRAHYLLNDDLLRRLDRAGIMVWNEAAIWQRDCCENNPPRENMLRRAGDIKRALSTVKGTVAVGRNHPSVITHAVANELSFRPNNHPGTSRFLKAAALETRKLDPYTPVSVDLKARLHIAPQSAYRYYDMLGLNQYFGWYRWTANLGDLGTYLLQMRRRYPRQALVMTEFGAEARPDLANAPPGKKGSYAFQSNFVGHTLDILASQPYMSGAIHWTLREFEIYPGWTGGAGRPPGPNRNTRHNKGLLTYHGTKKPAWFVARDRLARMPQHP